ncbi:hypothetical protein [Neptunicella marina]|uniref:hypothetical protein n=1 Tax=Neptunicella marina TaxID=2125989 RepID=UPI001645B4AC|nr:hypothetical protein [Neptunicella marina]
MSVDTYSVPHRFADTGAPLDFETWLQREKEIDKVVEQRVDIFNQSKAAGLSDDEILDKLKQFDATLPEDMTKTLGEPYGKDYKVEYDISPQYLAANLAQSREQAFKAMAQSYL